MALSLIPLRYSHTSPPGSVVKNPFHYARNTKSWTRPGWGHDSTQSKSNIVRTLSLSNSKLCMCLLGIIPQISLLQLAAHKVSPDPGSHPSGKFLSQIHRSTPGRTLMALLGSLSTLERFTVAKGMEYLINQHRWGDHSWGKNRCTIINNHTETECMCIMFFPTWPLQQFLSCTLF